MRSPDHDEIPDGNPPEEVIGDILGRCRTVAVVGLSDNPMRPSHEVAGYLKGRGYRIIPVNPTLARVLGEKSYPDLESVPAPVDIVVIFRRPDKVPGIVDDAIRIGAGVVWMQLGIVNNQAARKARDAGLEVVQSRCMMREIENRASWA
jgi:uncharacterized protein